MIRCMVLFIGRRPGHGRPPHGLAGAERRLPGAVVGPRWAWSLALGLGLACHVAAAPPPEALPEVKISGTRQPVEKSYRRLLDGLKWFAAQAHRLPPGRQLQFRFLPLVPGAEQGPMTLRVWTDDWTQSLPVQEGGRFELPMRAEWASQGAMVSPTRPQGTLTWRVQVGEPQASPWRLRLGDLRLACEVAYEAGLISFPSAWPRLLRARPPCTPDAKPSDGAADYLLFAEQALFSVHLQDGPRRWELPLEWLHATGRAAETTQARVWQDRVFWLPLADPCLSDEAEVVLTPVQELPLDSKDSGPSPDPAQVDASGDVTLLPAALWQAPDAAAPATKAEALAQWGPTAVRRLASGHEIWLYRADLPWTAPGPLTARALQARCAALPSLVVPAAAQGTWRLLFDPAGQRVRQLRLPLP